MPDNFFTRTVPTSFFLTPLGGIAIKLINKTGSASVKGELVKANTALADSFILAGVDEAEVLGIVYEAGVADGNECFVIVYGIAEVLLEDSLASTYGHWARTSVTQAGRADITNAAPPGGGIIQIDQHLKEIGHCIESVTAGTNKLAKIVTHFN
jgi:hypothetical protein